MVFSFELTTLVFSALSLVSSVWVSLVYYYNKELHQHPSEILAWISIFEISMCHHSIALALDTDLSINGEGPHIVLQILSLYSIDEETARGITCAINQSLFCGAVTAVMSYNLFLCIDLIITLRNPLITGRSRMKYYHIFGFLLMIAQMIYNAVENSETRECRMSMTDYYIELWNYGWLATIYGMYLLAAAVSLVYSWVRIAMDYTSLHGGAKEYFRRHISYIIIFTFVWSFAMLNFFDKGTGLAQQFGIILVCSSGFILAFVRNGEPLFWSVSKRCIKQRQLRQAAPTNYKELYCDMWNIPISQMMQKNLGSQTTYCLLYGIYEALRRSQEVDDNFTYEAFSDENYRNVIPHKISDRNLSHDLYGLRIASSPYFLVEEYAPKVFQHLRQLDQLTAESTKNSINPQNNKSTLYSVHSAQGGSGSLFIFTEDGKFVIKTIRKAERKTLVKNLLKDYHKHIYFNRGSYLCRIYGVYTVRVPGLAPLELLLIENLKRPNMIRFYDLKGSTHKRTASKRIDENFIGPFKDRDFLLENQKIDVSYRHRKHILNEVLKDATLLMRHQIMDYSILLQVFNREQNDSFSSEKEFEWYTFAIIDYLNQYTFKKKVEYYIRYIQLGKNIKTISVRQPIKYFRRFFNFLSEKILAGRTSDIYAIN